MESPCVYAGADVKEAEHQELLVYVERAEEMDVIRLEAMMKLAELRAVTLGDIMIAVPIAPSL
jgi:hypothetical protein